MTINADDIADLKVGVHKLAIAIEELALKKYAQGKIDLSKLPWFTSNYVPGDSIKLSSNHLPTVNLENSMVKANGETFVAHKVLEEIPLPNFMKEMAENERNDSDGSDVSATIMSQKEKEVQLSYEQKVLDEMPRPNFIKKMAQNVTNEENDSNRGDIKLILDNVVRDHRQIKQQNYEYIDHFQSSDGPVFLYIYGDFGGRGIVNDYYGKSFPFKTHTTKNLSADNPWFVFGGNYSGALKAWFCLKFPHLTGGSLASSAIVQAFYDFIKFDQQIGVSARPECKVVLQEVTQLYEERLKTNEQALKSTFGAVVAFQYGNPNKLCSPLVEDKKVGQDVVSVYVSYVKDYYLRSFQLILKGKELISLMWECDVQHHNDSIYVFDPGGLHIATYPKLYPEPKRRSHPTSNTLLKYHYVSQIRSLRTRIILWGR